MGILKDIGLLALSVILCAFMFLLPIRVAYGGLFRPTMRRTQSGETALQELTRELSTQFREMDVAFAKIEPIWERSGYPKVKVTFNTKAETILGVNFLISRCLEQVVGDRIRADDSFGRGREKFNSRHTFRICCNENGSEADGLDEIFWAADVASRVSRIENTIKWREPWLDGLRRKGPPRVFERPVLVAAVSWTLTFLAISCLVSWRAGTLMSGIPSRALECAALGVALAVLMELSHWLSVTRISLGPKGIEWNMSGVSAIILWEWLRFYHIDQRNQQNILELTRFSGSTPVQLPLPRGKILAAVEHTLKLSGCPKA